MLAKDSGKAGINFAHILSKMLFHVVFLYCMFVDAYLHTVRSRNVMRYCTFVFSSISNFLYKVETLFFSVDKYMYV